MTTLSDKIQSLADLEVCTGTAGGVVTPAIIISPTANAAAANILTITNASAGQATTLTIPDVGGATGKVPVASGALVSGNLVQNSGTAGVQIDSGISGSSVSTLITQVGNVTTVSVSLSAANITGMYATPIQLVAAPGAGKVLIVQEAILYTNSTGQTPFGGGGATKIQYDSTANGAGTNTLTTTISAANITAASSQVLGGLIPSTTALTGVTNKGIFLSNATGAFTGGTGTVIVVSLTYQTITATV